MSVHDPRYDAYRRPAPRMAAPRAPSLSPLWRRLIHSVWSIEHAFERARADARPEEDTRVRISIVFLVFAAVFILLAGGASYAALFRGEAPRFGGGAAALTRGDLTDRHGRLLAANITHYGFYIDPSEVWDREAALRDIRRALPRVSEDRLRRVLYGDRRLIVTTGLTPTEKRRLHDLALGGLSFEPEDRRVYPLGASAAHLIGFADTGGEGVSGAELAFDGPIRAAGAQSGAVALSIDLRVQGVLESELRAAVENAQAQAGVGLVVDATTGEVLGMASYPTFDPAHRDRASEGATLNRALSAHYEMGSVFKTFVVAAGLETGAADVNTTFDASEPFMIGNRRISDFHAQNRVMTLEEVFLHSSNIGTSRLAVEMGPDVMRDFYGRLGLLEAAPIELKESAAPVVPRNWSDSTLASLSFGYAIMITPAQMTAATAALVNGGIYRPLSLRRGGARAEGRRVVSEATSATIRELMRANVLRGSGARADAPGLRVGGKTGSANKLVNGRYDPTHAVGSFSAVFPADGPADARRYVVFVLVDEPGAYPRTGGFVAAPAVGRIIDRIGPMLGVGRRFDPAPVAEVRP
ncbi:peptidoglycan D,D-transpeptidase FtsI family protein [Brevundimonas balnearis]|uniref:peptidoglycan D,D-transpeptidase FtsI family protein n=1 Tax=Brevundimonas balnearis TaxID=1572858 RepID=UPI00406BD086